jgi:DNA-binding NtrC family response regulator
MGSEEAVMNLALVVEDDPDLREELCRGLDSAGWSSRGSSAAGASSLAAEAGEGKVSAIFFSIADGIREGLIRDLRKRSPGAMAVAIADMDRGEMLDRALSQGLIDDFVALPFSKSDLSGIAKTVGAGA